MALSLVPNYEVKLLLDPSKVLESDNELSAAVLSAFKITESPEKMHIQFMDNKDRAIYKGGWNLRIRKIGDDDKVELTYKKRYTIVDGDFSIAESSAKIDEALKRAEHEGFDSSTPFKPQVEVGYQKQTLSLSHDKDISNNSITATNLPPRKESGDLFADNAPDKLKEWLFKNPTVGLCDAIVYGPVHAKRYKGKRDGVKISIEVWPIQTSQTDTTLEPIIEASFKADKLDEALEGHAKLEEYLQKKEWFVAKDSLKTKLIMERYGETAMDL